MSDDFYDDDELADDDTSTISHLSYASSHSEALRPDCHVFTLGLKEALARSQLYAMGFISADKRPTASELQYFWYGKAYALQAFKTALEGDMSNGERMSNISFTITPYDEVVVSATTEQVVYPISG